MSREEEYTKRIRELNLNLEKVQSDIENAKDPLIISELKGAKVVLEEHIKIMEEKAKPYITVKPKEIKVKKVGVKNERSKKLPSKKKKGNRK